MYTKTYRIQNKDGWIKIAQEVKLAIKQGDVVTLVGSLGAGKTTFARYLMQELAGEAIDVPSPTFTLVQEYELPRISIWHFDLYRLEEKEADILELGWEEARRYGVALVEWPERLGKLLPKNHLEIKIDFDKIEENAREVEITQY